MVCIRDVCNISFFRDFANYLAFEAKKKNGEPFASGTCMQYLSGVKESIKRVRYIKSYVRNRL